MKNFFIFGMTNRGQHAQYYLPGDTSSSLSKQLGYGNLSNQPIFVIPVMIANFLRNLFAELNYLCDNNKPFGKRGRLAQRERRSFTHSRSGVQIPHRPPLKNINEPAGSFFISGCLKLAARMPSQKARLCLANCSPTT